jgi:hypothetical protein
MSNRHSNPLRAVAFLALIPALAVAACSSLPPSLRDAAKQAGALDAGMAACALAHGFDGKVSETDAVKRWCSKLEYAKPWEELARQAAALVEAQRAGKVRPDAP